MPKVGMIRSDRPVKDDVLARGVSHIQMDVIHSEFRPVRVGGGVGHTIGHMVDEMTNSCLERGERIQRFNIVINDDDWDALQLAAQRGDDVSIKDE
jgi:hypothetical protein